MTSRFFAYRGAYTPSNTIDPGTGYWVKVSQSGKLVLSSTSTGAAKPGAIRIIPTGELPPAPPGPGAAGKARKPVPTEYSLAQNYPNPFNPATVIHYSLPAAGFVTLKVYNILGEEAGTLVNEFQEAGYKSASWDAAGLPSGIYLYRLISGSFTDLKKMMVVR